MQLGMGILYFIGWLTLACQAGQRVEGVEEPRGSVAHVPGQAVK